MIQNKRFTINDGTLHDKKVIEIAKQYKRRRFKVKIALKGNESPPNLNGCVPDIYAVRGIETHIIEVETKATLKRHASQHECFRTAAPPLGAKFSIIMAEE